MILKEKINQTVVISRFSAKVSHLSRKIVINIYFPFSFVSVLRAVRGLAGFLGAAVFLAVVFFGVDAEDWATVEDGLARCEVPFLTGSLDATVSADMPIIVS